MPSSLEHSIKWLFDLNCFQRQDTFGHKTSIQSFFNGSQNTVFSELQTGHYMSAEP